MRFSLILACFALCACGFTPLYGAGSQGQFAHVAIDTLPDRDGVYLRNRLVDRLHANGEASALWRLHVSPVREERTDLDITKTSTSTRGQMQVEVDIVLYVLNAPKEAKPLLQRNVRATTSYNILSSEFTNRVSEDNARRNALDDLARQIELELALVLPKS